MRKPRDAVQNACEGPRQEGGCGEAARTEGHTASRVLTNGASACLDNRALQPSAPEGSPITQFLTTIPRLVLVAVDALPFLCVGHGRPSLAGD